MKLETEKVFIKYRNYRSACIELMALFTCVHCYLCFKNKLNEIKAVSQSDLFIILLNF